MKKEINGTANECGSINVIDPDTKQVIELCVFKHSNGGMFAIDASYIDQVLDDEISEIQDPLNENGLVQIS